MRRRAISVDLIPEVEDECIDDLAALCFEKTEKGEEMQCLQDNMDKLDESCRVSVQFLPAQCHTQIDEHYSLILKLICRKR